MKHFYFGTNLKMYKTNYETQAFLRELKELLKDFHSDILTLFVIPSFPALADAGRLLADSPLLLGAQNMHWADQGQFSGEVSADMLFELGVSLVMIGHSERRHIFGETDEELNKKVLTALRRNLIPLLCIGETKEEKDAGVSDEVLRMQLKQDLFGYPKHLLHRLFIAYEPVWAIGTGGTLAPADYVRARHKAIRGCLTEMFGEEGSQVPVLFGGSVNPENAPAYLELNDVDGLFVGRSAWKAKSYFNMVRTLFEDRETQ